MDDNDYIKEISELNAKNQHLTNTLYDEQIQKEKKYLSQNQIIAVLSRSIDNFRLTPRNLLKLTISLIGLSFIVFTLIIPIMSNSTPYIIWRDSGRGLSAKSHILIDQTSGSDIKSTRNNPAIATNVSLSFDGNKEVFNTSDITVQDVLNSRNIKLSYDYGVYPSLDSYVGDNTEIYIGKVQSKMEIKNVTDKFEVQKIDEPSILKGQEIVTQEGVNGLIQTTYIVNEVNGKEASRQEWTKNVLKERVDKVIKVGTAEPVNNGMTVSVPSSVAKKFAYNLLSAQGQADQFSCLERLWQRESGWRTTAGNKFSGAYGIPQSLPGSKMAAFGSDWRTNPETQIKWGLSYIRGRYGTPCSAWNHSQGYGWY